MASEDKDKLGSGPEPEAEGQRAPFSEGEPLLDQRLLDALLAAQSGQQSPLLDQNPIDGNELLLDDTSLSPGHEEDELAPMSNDLGVDEAPSKEGTVTKEDLDRLIKEHLAAMESTPADVNPFPQPPQEEGSLSQSELDRMMAQLEIPAEPAAAVDAPPPLLPDEPASLIIQDEAPAAAAPEDVSPMVLEESEVAEAPPAAPEAELAPPAAAVESALPEAPPDQALSQAELDRLLSSMSAQPLQEEAPAASAPPPSLGQSELDQLLSAQVENDAPLDQAALDALLAGLDQGAEDGGAVSQADIDALISGSGLTEPAQPSLPPTQPKPLTLSQSDLDALIGASSHTPPPPGPAPESNVVTQDMIDALIAAAGEPAPKPVSPESVTKVGSENLAAAATSPAPAPGLLKQETVAAPPKKVPEKGQQLPEMEEPKPAPKPKPPAKPRQPGSLRRNAVRLVTALAAGIIAGFGTFTVLYLNQERTPTEEALKASAEPTLAELMERAKSWMDGHEYAKAAALLDSAIEEAGESPERMDAKFLRMEAKYRGFHYEPGSAELAVLHGEMDTLIKEAPNHARTPEVLRWKAQLYEQDQLPYAAEDVYKQIIERYPTAPGLDQTLLDAARIANALKNPREAADYAQRLLNEFPGSPCGPQAHMILGDAYAMAGMQDDARTLYVRLADAEPNTQRGSEAYLRLGRLAMEQKEYDAAIHHLETCLKSSSSKEGNDAVYLLLAQAYRAKSRYADAEKTLNDLVNFFPDSAQLPAALVELSQVTEAMGNRKEAVRIAQQAASRFPGDPLALKNHGLFQGLEGNAYAAATALVSADEAGANDPAILLTAARHYRTLAMDEEAQRIYARLRQEYSKAPEALTAGVEEAETLYAMGKVTQAVDQLETLAKITTNPAQRLPVLVAAAKVYRDLGLTEAAADISKQIAASSEDPQVLAETAVDLVGTGNLEEAQQIMARINLAQVSGPTAYALLSGLGQALLKVDPQRGLDRMEEAYLNYPDARKPDDEQRLLQAYLAANRPAAARRMVMEMSAAAHNTPSQAPHLIVAAALWGDYLYGKGDYRAAADAYAMAVEGAGKSTLAAPVKSSLDWAKYQRANALLELADFQSSLALYKEVAGSGSPWAKEAGLKAEYAQLEQKLRGASPVETKKEG